MVNVWGIWNLLAHDVMFNNTSVLQPSGSNPLGKLVITPGGYFSVLITDSEIAIPLPNKTLWTKGSDADVARIAKSVVSYCGQYSSSYVGEQLVLATKVEASLDPAWMKTTQRRNVTFTVENGAEYMFLSSNVPIPTTLPVSFRRAAPLRMQAEVANSNQPEGLS
jgi:hypothetical protein